MDMQKLIDAIKAHGVLSDDDIKQAGEHGADAGFHGFIYTAEAAEFTRKNIDLIWELLRESADDQGVNIPTLIGQFKRVDMCDTPEGFDNLLAWFALEEAGRFLLDKDEEE